MTGLLSLTQWLSPAFPTGGFAYSHGLEQVISDKTVHDAKTLGAWLAAVLRHGAGWQDAVVLSAALGPGADHAALADVARALASGAERLAESLEQGSALARAVSGVTGREIAPACLPVALGQAAGPLGLPKGQVIALYLHSVASNLTLAAVRFVPLGQTEGQRVLADLHGLIEELAERAAGASLDDLASGALAADLAALRHETMDVRIFRT